MGNVTLEHKLLVVGSYLSPYVRKLLAVLELKGLAYEVDPIVPFYGNDEFTQLSPTRRIPVLIDGPVTLADSTVIIEYLNERYPEPGILPSVIEQRAKARWFEEYADSLLGDIFIWKYWNQAVINRFVWGKKPDEDILNTAINKDIPEIMDYLEANLPSGGFILGDLSIADIAIASFFRNLLMGRYELNSERWPMTANFVHRTLALPIFTALNPYEELSMRVPIHEHREALAGAGAPISAKSYRQAHARPGIMTRP